MRCRRCPRLVQWREQVAREKRAAFRDERLLGPAGAGVRRPGARASYVLGLAPAAHGGNRTGRVFTGDRSGDWLFAAMHRTGFANQPTSTSARRRPAPDRRLRGRGRPLRAAGQPAAARGARQLPSLCWRASSTLLPTRGCWCASGGFAWDGACRLLGPCRPKPRFGHGAEHRGGAAGRCSSAATTPASRTPSPAG